MRLRPYRRGAGRRRLGLSQQALLLLVTLTLLGLLVLVLLQRNAPADFAEVPSAFISIEDVLAESELHGIADAATGRRDSQPLLPHEAKKICDQHFGESWLAEWNSTLHTVCTPTQPAQNASTVHCRRISDPHMPAASAPQVMCHVSNLMVDPHSMHAARCPAHRPKYMCTVNTYNAYAVGAFKVACSWGQPVLEDFPRDHLRDIMGSFTQCSDNEPVTEVVAERTLLVTRESKEYSNVFHMLTDLFNTFLAVRMLGWADDTTSPRRVVLLDNHPEGPLDGIWAGVAAGGGVQGLQGPWNTSGSAGQPLLARASKLPAATRFRAAAFVPPGYGSLFFAHLYEDASCPHPTELFTRFRSWALRPLGLLRGAASLEQALVRVVYVSRQRAGGRSRRRVTRRVGNENAIMAMLARLPGAAPQLVDLADMPLLDQLRLLTGTDVLIGMHGAAMAWVVLMPPHAAAVELWPQSSGIWRCYEHLSHWAGLLYRRWEAPPLEPGPGGKPVHTPMVTDIDVQALEQIVVPLLREVFERKQQFADEHRGEG